MNGHQFEFTHDWISLYFPLWERLLPNYREPSILEIGCFEGRATVWFLQKFDGCHVTCIDTFDGSKDHRELGVDFSEVERRFNSNVAPWATRVSVAKGTSQYWLAQHHSPVCRQFQIILVDGSHVAADVLSDLVLSWPILASGGTMIIDDYGWGSGRPSIDTPRPAVDAFLACFFGSYKLLEKGYQVIIQKP
jgi:SAM-dependent methyltransferase